MALRASFCPVLATLRERSTKFGPGLIALSFVAAGFALFGSTGNDDSHITYWVADHLASSFEIVNYNGRPVEQSSSLALVLLLGLLGAITPVPAPLLGWLASVAFGVLTLLEAARLCTRLQLAGFGPALLVLAGFLPFLYWSTSGMEVTMTTFAGLWLLRVVCEPREGSPRRAAAAKLAAAATFVLVRPENVIVLPCMAVAALGWTLRIEEARAHRREALIAAMVALALAGGVTVLRTLIFGSAFPLPVSAKSAGFDALAGADYLLKTFVLSGVLLLPILALGFWMLLRDLARGTSTVSLPHALLGFLSFAGLAFVVGSGGDWMPAGRFVAMSAAACVLFGASTIHRALDSPQAVRTFLLLWATVNALCTVHFTHTAANKGRPGFLALSLDQELRDHLERDHPFSFPELASKPHLRDTTITIALLGILDQLDASPARPISIATGQAGMVPYYAFEHRFGALHLVDLCGLTDDEVSTCLGQTSESRWGTCVSLDRYFQDSATLAKCDLPSRPDVIHGLTLSDEVRKLLERHDYRIVYEQSGRIHDSARPRWFRGRLGAKSFIAVHGRHDVPASPPWRWDIGTP